MPARAPRVIVGYTQDVAHYLRLGDFFIGKPGPGSLSEALHCGLPVIVTRNAWTMPQERYNTDWVREQGVGLVLDSFAGLPAAVAALRRTAAASYAERVRRLDNRALFELPQILAGILHDARRAQQWQRGTGAVERADAGGQRRRAAGVQVVVARTPTFTRLSPALSRASSRGRRTSRACNGTCQPTWTTCRRQRRRG